MHMISICTVHNIPDLRCGGVQTLRNCLGLPRTGVPSTCSSADGHLGYRQTVLNFAEAQHRQLSEDTHRRSMAYLLMRCSRVLTCEASFSHPR